MIAWPSVHLSDVAKIDRDAIDPSAIATGTLYVGLEHIESGGRFLGVRPVSNGDLASTKFRFSSAHLLYGKLRPYLAKIAMPNFEGVCSTDILPILPGPKLDRAYLAHFLRQPTVVSYAASRSEGANLPRLSPKALARFEIPLPPLEEQQRIAAILDAADALRAKRRASIAKLDTLAQFIFIEMFGDWSKPGQNKRLFKLGDRLDFLTSGSRGWAAHYRDSGSLFLRIQNVRRDELSLDDVAFVDPPQTAEAERTRVCPGDVLLSITADLGRTAVVPDGIGDAFINQHLSILRSAKIIPRYLSAALCSPAGQRSILMKNREGVKAGLNFDDIRNIEIPDVDLAKQQRFADLARSIDTLKSSQKNAQNKLNELFLSLQHRAFRGEL
jgi:type I restriction enzyme S subunit